MATIKKKDDPADETMGLVGGALQAGAAEAMREATSPPRSHTVGVDDTLPTTWYVGVEPPAANVIEAICRVKRDLPGIGKGEQAPASMGGYAYRGIEQLTAHLQDLTAKHGIVIVPADVSDVRVTEFTTKGGAINTDTLVTYHWKVYGPGGVTDCIDGANVAIGRDNFDKGASKAGTQAFKEFLIKLFCIGEKASDPDANEPEERVIGSGQPPAERGAATPPPVKIDWHALGWAEAPIPDTKEGTPLAEAARDRHDAALRSIAVELDLMDPEVKRGLLAARREALGPLPLSSHAVLAWAGMVAEKMPVPPEATAADAAATLIDQLGAVEVVYPDDSGYDGSKGE